jgi:hypothetical protein
MAAGARDGDPAPAKRRLVNPAPADFRTVPRAPPCRRYNPHLERQVSLSSGARLGSYKIVAPLGNARLILVIHSDNDRSVPVQQAMRSFIADVDKKK